MLTTKDIIIIGKWLQSNFIGDFHIEFAKGFEDIYILIAASADMKTRTAYKLTEILKGEEK